MHSIIDPDRPITPYNWAVSLVVKPEGKNPEHAFLIVEGISQDKKTINFKRYEFVIGEEPFTNKLKRCKGLVVPHSYIYRFRREFNADEQSRFFWANVMKDIKSEEGCYGLSWRIGDREANILDSNIQANVANPPDYQISGDHAILPKSSSQSGHNCFTWAREKLYQLNVKDINDDPDLKISYEDLFAARTSRHLPIVDPELEKKPDSFCCIL